MDNPFTLSEEQTTLMQELLDKNTRDVPFFYDEGVCDVSFVPIEEGQLRVFHHKPEKPVSTRPVLFVPGFGTSPWSWRHFSVPMYQKAEYYFLETREKASSIINNRRKAKMTVDQTAKDLGQVIEYLGLNKRDFVLFGASYCGGVVLDGLAQKYFTAPTVVTYDPLKSWKNHRKYAFLIAPLPPFVLSIFRFVITKLFLIGMKNKTQKERVLDYIKHAVAWKWRKAGFQNYHYDLEELLPKIAEEVFIFHGPYDRFHPAKVYIDIAKKIPNGRYIFMETPEEFRELLAGIIALEYSKITATDGLPELFQPFEFDVSSI